MDNPEEMTKLFKKYNLPKLKQEETGNMNRPTTNTEIKTDKKKVQQVKSQGQMASQVNSIKCLEN